MKFKITLTAVCEYEVRTENYHNADPQQMMAADIESYRGDPLMLLEDANVTFVGEVITTTEGEG